MKGQERQGPSCLHRDGSLPFDGSVTAWETSWWLVGRRSGCEVVAGAHRLVAGEHSAQVVDGRVAELGSDSEQVVGARRPSGFAALHVAAQKGKADVVRYLVERGARTDLVDSNGRMPIDLAGVPEGTRAGAAPAPVPASSSAPPAGRADVPAASASEIRGLLQSAASRR